MTNNLDDWRIEQPHWMKPEEGGTGVNAHNGYWRIFAYPVTGPGKDGGHTKTGQGHTAAAALEDVKEQIRSIKPSNPLLDQSHADRFVEYFRILMRSIHQVNVNNGWFDNPDAVWLKGYAESGEVPENVGMKLAQIANKLHNRNNGEMIALMHSELSEALEGDRHHNPPSDHIPEFSALEEEMADTVIRIADFAEYRKLRLAEAIVAKLKYNAGRGYKHGGKKC